MVDPVHRLVAYGQFPEIYEKPTPQECLQAADEIKSLRAELIENAQGDR